MSIRGVVLPAAGSSDIWPRTTRSVPLPAGRQLRLDVRAATVTMVLSLLAVGVGLWSLTIGETAISVDTIVAALTGHGDPATRLVVVDWRLPRIVVGLTGGAALAVGGVIFQTITRNPLGSPDVIGFSTGAYTGALIASLVVTTSGTGITLGALLGGFATGAVVFALTWRSGGTSGYRFIVVGIGVSAILGAVSSYLLITVDVRQAISAATWGAGSLVDAGWRDAIGVGVCLAVMLPAAGLLGSQMVLLELGDDTARSLGLHTGRTFGLLVVIAIVLTAVVTAVAGPIVFVALAAPHLARRLTRASGAHILPSAAMGALLLGTCDLIARTVVSPAEVPVGMVTMCLGGVYLIWLLATEATGSRRVA
ncbi:FecCD family ABC transporter permease [Aeromicrobium fastidiosum]|uniref:Iron chelate uptake ABC transporter family permease subunit n=1 Tax=Aeromicrobium fastidiosum TaxID=52699 RepID=A0A641APL3_9ACTN|nr:iron chelate uptake ABC transporter family permease subunit [Aeromicrobium fastidiosum]KAA1379875.1 iron chelate uptake ABC transporter family permease subunit [Aeromicrobium fastidiosum]MBP2389379.1 iron complex transport system permease protein [Aeromicrobium fastidiosum]